MSGGETASMVFALLCLVLVGSSLFSRQLPIGRTVKMAVAWVGIFGLAYVGFLFKDEIVERAKADISTEGVTTAGGELRLRKREDGHFWVQGSVNAQPVEFMIDSGATMTTLSKDVADRIGVKLDDTDRQTVDTANGELMVWSVRLDTIQIGTISRQAMAADVSPHQGDTNLLGMNFLSSLTSWRVEGDDMILTP